MDRNGFGLIGSIIFIFLVGTIVKIVPILLAVLLIGFIIALINGAFKDE